MDPRFWEAGKGAYVSQAAEQKKTVVGGGKAYAIDVVNIAAADRFLYVFDAITDAGATILPPFQIPTKGFISLEYDGPIEFVTGLTLASSTTQATYTAGGADFFLRIVSK